MTKCTAVIAVAIVLAFESVAVPVFEIDLAIFSV